MEELINQINQIRKEARKKELTSVANISPLELNIILWEAENKALAQWIKELINDD